MMMDFISCVVFMWFNEKQKQVYDRVLKPTILNHCKRKPYIATDAIVTANKVSVIKAQIETADLIVIDITGGRPAVMWELGYADARGKPVLLLNSKDVSPELPFYLRERDVITYTSGNHIELQRDFDKALESVVSRLIGRGHSIIERDPVRTMFDRIRTYVEPIREDSLAAEFILHECQRAFARLSELENGRFELRHIRPMKDIVENYCRYYGRLSRGSTVSAVSCFEFWRDFTFNGTSFEYLNANLEASKQGAVIKRYFVVGDDMFRFGSGFKPEFGLYEEILRKVAHWFSGPDSPHDSKVFVSSRYEKDVCETYGNFALLEREKECLVMEPLYEGKGTARRMVNTKFFIVSTDPDAHLMYKIADYEVRDYRRRAEQAGREAAMSLDDFLARLGPSRRIRRFPKKRKKAR